MVALQIGLPGTQEFVIILLIFVLLAGIAVLIVAPVVLLLRWRSDDDETQERVAELEDEVERLRDQQGASQDDTREPDD
jgi:sec-independent protein translocase protein TatA